MDVALDGADHDLADRLGAGLREQGSQDLHSALHRVGGEQHFGNEQDAVAEVDADDPHALDERVVQDFLGAPTALEEDPRRLHDLVAQPVVEVVVNLLGELLVVQVAQVELGLLWHARSSDPGRTPSRKMVAEGACAMG